MRLLILRHGKAERDSPTGRDEDRPLAERGRAQAKFIGESMTRKHPLAPVRQRPEVVVSSQAVRAADTARIVAAALKMPVRFDRALWPGSPLAKAESLIRELIGEVTEEGAALIVGHLPQLDELVELLGADGELRTGELVAFDVLLEEDELGAIEIGWLRADE